VRIALPGAIATRRARRRSLAERRRFGPPLASSSGHGAILARPILEARNVRKRFDGLAAVDGVSVSVRRGTIHALIGPNDAGKTTLLNLLSGATAPDEGRIVLEGKDVTGVPAWRLAKQGIGRSFQHASLFWALSATENLVLARAAATGATGRLYGRTSGKLRRESDDALSRFGLGVQHAEVAAGDLSAGDQRSLEVAVAMASRPRILLLDEPTAGLSPRETREAVALIKRLVREEDMTLVLVEHDMEVVFGAADWITVMHCGRVLAHGPPREISANPEVRQAYLGADPI
jgi:ABC-type branched-subunit amino acid transport system ATPase component